MKQKIVSSLNNAAVADIADGARIMFGGFGGFDSLVSLRANQSASEG